MQAVLLLSDWRAALLSVHRKTERATGPVVPTRIFATADDISRATLNIFPISALNPLQPRSVAEISHIRDEHIKCMGRAV